MDKTIKPSRYKDISDNILNIENDFQDKILKLHCKSYPTNSSQIMGIIKYLNSTDYKNYKFNQYSIKKNEDFSTIIFNYVSPRVMI